MRKLTAGLSALAILISLPGCDREPSAAASSLPDKPSLVIYTSHNEEVYAPIVKEFKERTGIWVTVKTGGSNELMEQIAAEEANPQCDVMFGGDLISHQAYQACFENYQSPEAEQISAMFQIEDSRSTPFSALPLVIICNSKIVPPKNIPDSWESLLAPDWKGSIAFANPANSASCYSALTTMMQATGKPWQTLEQFAANLDGKQLDNSPAIVSNVADGSYLIGVALEDAAIRQSRSKPDVSVVYPSDGTSVLLDAASLVKNGPNPEHGKSFIDFTISRDIQLMISADCYRRPVREDVSPPKWLKPLSEIPIVNDDPRWSIENRDAILSQWSGLLD